MQLRSILALCGRKLDIMRGGFSSNSKWIYGSEQRFDNESVPRPDS